MMRFFSPAVEKYAFPSSAGNIEAAGVVELFIHRHDSLTRKLGNERLDHLKVGLEGLEHGTITCFVDKDITLESTGRLNKIVVDRTLDREISQDVIKLLEGLGSAANPLRPDHKSEVIDDAVDWETYLGWRSKVANVAGIAEFQHRVAPPV